MRTVGAWMLVVPLAAWGTAALWIDGPESRAAAGGLAGLFLAAVAWLLVRVRPLRRALGGFALLFAALLVWWLSIHARNDRPWLPDVAHPPTASVDGDVLTVRNLRNFAYRSESDFTPRWEERRYDLRELRGVDLFLSYWGSPWIAHTIASWDFGDDGHLAISIETRKEVGEAYSALLGFFRQFELYYVAADERDVIGVRAVHRGEQVFLYRLATPPAVARDILLDYVAAMNGLAASPDWYNALTHNCTTTIRRHAQHVAPGNPWDWRILVNGRIDQLGYERGQIDTSLPFPVLRRRSDVTERARAAGGADDFSARIREGLPGF